MVFNSQYRTCVGQRGEKDMLTRLLRYLKKSKGATAIEYALIASLIAVAAITAMKTLGNKLTALFENVSSELNTNTSSSSGSGGGSGS